MEEAGGDSAEIESPRYSHMDPVNIGSFVAGVSFVEGNLSGSPSIGAADVVFSIRTPDGPPLSSATLWMRIYGHPDYLPTAIDNVKKLVRRMERAGDWAIDALLQHHNPSQGLACYLARCDGKEQGTNPAFKETNLASPHH